METEQQLISAIQGGDRKALRRLYDRYSGYAMVIALRYVPDRDEVRDVVQDSFVSILTSVNSFRYQGEGSLRSWVGRVVANRSVDYMRAHERMLLAAEIPDGIDENENDDVPVEEVPPDILTEMIGRLPMGYRVVLNLYVFGHLSHRDIAKRLGIKESTSASQFSRAKKMLAEMVKEYINRQKI